LRGIHGLDSAVLPSRGQSFDGWYPSLMSPGFASGHISIAGRIFFMNGCDRGLRQFVSRRFTIAPP